MAQMSEAERHSYVSWLQAESERIDARVNAVGEMVEMKFPEVSEEIVLTYHSLLIAKALLDKALKKL